MHWAPWQDSTGRLCNGQLNALAPPYLVDDCNLVSDDIHRLRSAVSFTCALPRTRTRLGDRSFAVTGPRVWNCLPAASHRMHHRTKAQHVFLTMESILPQTAWGHPNYSPWLLSPSPVLIMLFPSPSPLIPSHASTPSPIQLSTSTLHTNCPIALSPSPTQLKCNFLELC